MNALRTLHAALVAGGLIVDTQPLSPDSAVEGSSGELGRLDMRDWARTIAAVDGGFESAIRAGLFALKEERSFVVADSFDSGDEMLTVVREWRGTRIPRALETRVAREQGAVHVHQDVRLRLLQAL